MCNPPSRRRNLRSVGSGTLYVSSRFVLMVAVAASLGSAAKAANSLQSGPDGGDNNGPSSTTSVQHASPRPEGVPLEEVTVTARKREERLIDVPVVASVLGSAQLQQYNTTDLEQLDSLVPGVHIYHADGGGAGGGISIRGVGSLATDYGAEEPVAVVIDGMAFTRGHILDTGFFDLQSIEILKGPQSLFFGKNSPAGVIDITSVSPGRELEGYLRAGYEIRTVDPTLEGAISVPVSDKLSIRFAVHGEDMQGGWATNDARQIIPNPLPGQAGLPLRGASYDKYPQTKELLGRFTAVYRPNDRFDLTFKAYGSVRHDNDGAAVTLAQCNDGIGGHPYYDGLQDPTQTCDGKLHLTINSALAPAAVAATLTGVAPGSRFFMNSVNYVYTLNMNYRFDNFTVSSITGIWDHREREYTGYSWDSYAGITSKQGESGASYTQEIRVQSNFHFPVNFTVGGFFEKDQYGHIAPITLLPLGPYPLPGPYFGTYMTWNNIEENSNESYSFFGQASWKILPNLELAAGGRWSHESRHSLVGNAFNAFDAILPEAENPFSPAGIYYHPHLSYENFSPEATLTWHPRENLTVYGAYKTGYLAAGIANPGSVPNLTQLTPSQQNSALVFGGETVKGFEGGLKGSFLDGRLSGDFDLFRYKYYGLQVAVFNPQTISFSVQNAASAINEGVEAQGAFRLNSNFSVRAALSYYRLHYGSYGNAQCYPGQTMAEGCMSGVVGGIATQFQDQSGKTYGGAPFQATVGGTYDKDISTDWSFQFTVDASFFTRGPTILGQPGTSIAPYSLVNMSAKVYQKGGPWEFAIIGTNITDTIYVDPYGNKPLGMPGDLTGYLHPPREVTLQVTRRF